jgi:hypothetical protein
MNRLTLAAAFTLATLSTGAIAQSNEDQQACMDDAFRVCGAFIPDRGRVTTCMVQNKSQLSAACQVVMNRYAPPNATPVQTASATPTRTVKPAALKTAGNTRPGKPLNITAR